MMESSISGKPLKKQSPERKQQAEIAMINVTKEDLDTPFERKETNKSKFRKEKPDPLRPTSAARSDKSGSFYDMEFSPSHMKKGHLSDEGQNEEISKPADNAAFEF
jgi:hypothetical protein